jgi:hypothetical protein
VTKPDHIAVLEWQQTVLEDEIKKTLHHYPTDNPTIHNLMSFMLHLRDELEKFHHKMLASRPLH